MNMTRKGAVCTIIAKNYLAHARCLMDSVAQFHPELARFAVLVDRIDNYFDSERESFTIISSDCLDIPHAKWFHFKYTLLELSTAVKPYAIEFLFGKYDFDFVIYLDPDILVCSDIGPLLERLGEYSLLVTPHLTEPLNERLRPSELDILRAGVYNLGFLGVARTEEALVFLDWWKQRLYERCVVDLPRGLFVDQRWFDFAPSFVSRLCVVRDPSFNVGYWNISQRELSLSDGTFLVRGSPLRFFHFSGFEPENSNHLSKHQSGYLLSELGALKDLAKQYSRLLYDSGYAKCRRWPYAYECFSNGVRIPDIGRPLHQECPGIADVIADPFSDEGFRVFVRIWNEPLDRTAGGRPAITRLAYRLYRTRSDVQAAMPDIFNGDYQGFLRWLASDGQMDHDLPDVFVAPFKEGVDEGSPGSGPGSSGRTSGDVAGGSGDFWDLRERPAQDAGPEGLPLAHSISTGSAGVCMTRLALQIYDKRPDLQAFFPNPCGRDSIKYLVWLLSYGRRQYVLSEVYLSTLRRQWAEVVDSLPNFWSRLRYRTLLTFAVVSAAVGPFVGRTIRARFWQRLFGRRGRVSRLKIAAQRPTQE